MGAGGSVAQELAVQRHHTKHHTHQLGNISSTTASQCSEMLGHLRNRFAEEVEVLRSKYGSIDQDALIVKLLMEEFSFTTVEAEDLPVLKNRRRDKTKVYLLGSTNFLQTPREACVNVTNLNAKALEMVGDEQLSLAAREALPANVRTSKKAVELMGSTKVVTEKKALKRLGSEMTKSMRALQLKTERKEQQREEISRNAVRPSADAGGEGGSGSGAGREVAVSMSTATATATAAAAATAAGRGIGEGGGSEEGATKSSSPNSSTGSPGCFTPSNMARRATRLLTEVPKFISDMGTNGGDGGGAGGGGVDSKKDPTKK